MIPGEVKNLKNLGCKLRAAGGWNNVTIKNKHAYFEDVKDDMDFYFVNSYVFLPTNQSNVIGSTNYDLDFCSVIASRKYFWYPISSEKSSKSGLKYSSNF